MSPLQAREVPFKFQLSDWTLFQLSISMQMRSIGARPVWAGGLLDRTGVEAKVRRLIRRHD